jgi:hypothetical protein
MKNDKDGCTRKELQIQSKTAQTIKMKRFNNSLLTEAIPWDKSDTNY